MTLHLFYKEWLKTRWAFLYALTAGVCVILYIFAGVENRITLIGAKNYMLRVLYDDPQVIYYSSMRYVPLLMALCVGITQWIPEVAHRRIRLTLHLPAGKNRLVITMAGFGIAMLTVGNLLFAALLLLFNMQVFPWEITAPVMASIVPWLLGSYAAYGFIALIAMEPNRWRQLIYTVIGWYVTGLFITGVKMHGAYAGCTPVLAITALAVSCLVLYSAYRFYKGER